MLKGSWNFVCVFGGLWKIGEVNGEGVNSGYRFKGLIIWAGLAGFVARDLSTLVKRNKNQLCDYMTTKPARPSIVMP